MRLLLAATLLVAGAVLAQDDPYKSGDDLQAVIAAKCSDGCVVFSRKEAKELEDQLGEILTRRQKEASERGVKYQAQACPSLI
jgi:hypothetical protein